MTDSNTGIEQMKKLLQKHAPQELRESKEVKEFLSHPEKEGNIEKIRQELQKTEKIDEVVWEQMKKLANDPKAQKKLS